MTPRVLITGSTGFIGTHATPILRRLGYEVYPISRTTKPACDLSDKDQISLIIETVKPTHLLHLAWDVNEGYIEDTARNYKWFVISTNLINEFVKQGGQRITIAGTQRNPEINKTPYGFWKNELHKWCHHYCIDEGVSYTNGRIFYVYGSGEKPGRLVPYIINTLLDGNDPQTSNKAIDILDSRDVASALCSILDSEITGPVDIGTGNPVSIKQIEWDVRNILGMPENVVGEPDSSYAAYTAPLHGVWKPRISLYEGMNGAVEYWKQKRK